MKTMTFGVLAALSLSSLPLSAQAADWQPLASSGGQTWTWDAASVQRTGGNVVVTLKVQYDPPQTSGSQTTVGGTETVNINCAAHTYVDIGGTKVSPTGEVISSWNTPGSVEALSEGSPGALVAARLCP